MQCTAEKHIACRTRDASQHTCLGVERVCLWPRKPSVSAARMSVPIALNDPVCCVLWCVICAVLCSCAQEWRDVVTRAAALAAAQAANRRAARSQDNGPARQATATPSATIPAASTSTSPPTQLSSSQSDTNTSSTSDSVKGVLSDGLIRAFNGVSPSLVSDLCRLAGATHTHTHTHRRAYTPSHPSDWMTPALAANV